MLQQLSQRVDYLTQLSEIERLNIYLQAMQNLPRQIIKGRSARLSPYIYFIFGVMLDISSKLYALQALPFLHDLEVSATLQLTLVLLNPDIPFLCKQCRSRLVSN